MMNGDILKSNRLATLVNSEECCIYRMQNKTGNGTMTVYRVFPGILLAYNDYHMQSCFSEFQTAEDLLCIDHCREGRLEYRANEAAYSYVEAGDLKIDRRLRHTGHFSFPLSHYHGITISISISDASVSLREQFRGCPVDLPGLQKKYCKDFNPIVLHGAPSIDHIFSELYAVPEKIKLTYFKIKILELLIYLDALELPKTQNERPYFYKSQVEKIKAIQALMTKQPQRRYTIEELSSMFDIPLTPLKRCFKSVYGSPVNTYMRIYRMNHAAVLLKQNKSLNVAEIAGLVGYDSPSKFSSAFKEVMGKTPMNYRMDIQ